MDVKMLTDTVEQLKDEYLKVWIDICNIESPTRYKAGVDAVGNYLAALSEKKGWLVERYPQPVAGDVLCITMNPDAKKEPICFSGHMDTVHEIGLFGDPPVRIEGDRLYGPGAEDCKGGIAAGFLAMDALSRCGFTDRPVRMLLQSDEEGGSSTSGKATIKYICERAKGSAAFLNLEGGEADVACFVRKGIITFLLTVNGVAAHASNCAKKGANAIAEMAHKIIELEKLKDDDGLTCNCGVISGGSVPNTVPDVCQLKINIRFATQEQLEYAREYVQKVADTVYVPGCTCTVEQATFRVAMEYCERNQKLLDHVNEILGEHGFPLKKMVRRKGGSDAADVTVSGTPCIDSLGVDGDFIHNPGEFGYIHTLAESAKKLAVITYCF